MANEAAPSEAKRGCNIPRGSVRAASATKTGKPIRISKGMPQEDGRMKSRNRMATATELGAVGQLILFLYSRYTRAPAGKE